MQIYPFMHKYANESFSTPSSPHMVEHPLPHPSSIVSSSQLCLCTMHAGRQTAISALARLGNVPASLREHCHIAPFEHRCGNRPASLSHHSRCGEIYPAALRTTPIQLLIPPLSWDPQTPMVANQQRAGPSSKVPAGVRGLSKSTNQCPVTSCADCQHPIEAAEAD